MNLPNPEGTGTAASTAFGNNENTLKVFPLPYYLPAMNPVWAPVTGVPGRDVATRFPSLSSPRETEHLNGALCRSPPGRYMAAGGTGGRVVPQNIAQKPGHREEENQLNTGNIPVFPAYPPSRCEGGYPDLPGPETVPPAFPVTYKQVFSSGSARPSAPAVPWHDPCYPSCQQ